MTKFPSAAVAILLAATMSATGPVSAQTHTDESCALLASTAGTIMKNRQQGVPLADMIRRASTGSDKRTNELIRKIVIEAYETSLFLSERAQQREQTEFENRWLLWCYANR